MTNASRWPLATPWLIGLLACRVADRAPIASPPPAADQPVLKQPFDREPFHPVRIPDWVWETTGVGYTLSGASPEIRAKAVRHGVTISEMGFVDPLYVYYDSALLKKRSPHVPPDRLEKELAEYKRLGLRVLAVYPPTLQGEVYERHPDWRRIPTNTAEIPQVDLERFPHGGMLCPLGPYGDFLIEVLAEIASKFPDVSAFSFDGLHHGGVCYCRACRENYRAQNGREIPNADMEDPAFRRYQHWADRRLEALVRRIQARLKAIRPEIALVTWTTNAGRFGHFRSVPRNMPARMNLLFDAPDQEFWLDETNRGASVVPAFANAYIWATTNHRVAFSEPYLMTHGRPYSKSGFPGHEVLCRMMLAATWGAMPSIAVMQPEHLQDSIWEALAELQARRPWLVRKRPERWAALVMSDNTNNFYGRDPARVEERTLAPVLGFFRAALEAHLPVTVIADWNLTPEDLAAYRVLILPNTACLDDAQAEAVRGFVRNGGGLVASLDVSRFDEFGDPRPDFALADVLGVRFDGIGRADAGELAPAGGPEEALMDRRRETFRGPSVRVRPAGAREAATLVSVEPADPAPAPAALVHAFGKGKVVYFGAGIDAAYYLYAYPYQRGVLTRAIRAAASVDPPYEVTAPMCVHATFFRREPDRLLVQLFNDLNTTAQHARPDDDVPLREEVVPIRDITIFCRIPGMTKATQQPEGRALRVVARGGGIEVTVPELKRHAIVVLEP
jgi:hypothetical protein